MSTILQTISGPQDLKNLTEDELTVLCSELREAIINTVSVTGGHLAPNLGVVELTVAIHLSFDSPRDKIVWDVGHQCYVHKLLTGRKDRFNTLRQYGGLSGFPSPAESEHDTFVTGHSSTSISAALGLAKARDLLHEDYSVVAVIGDGSIGGGMAFEALNHAGHLGTSLIVVLNDNEMSISPNVGALAAYLTRVRFDPRVMRLKKDLEGMVRNLPAIGRPMSSVVARVKGSVKYLVVPGMLFEELGFTYIGPVNGHDVQAVRRALSDARRNGGPVLVHVLTTKGKGYSFSEANPEDYHGVNPFDPTTGVPIGGADPTETTFTSAFGEELVELARHDSRVVAITAAMTRGTGLTQFAEEFKDRFFDVGIAEQHAVTFAGGLAKAGMRPVVAIYSTFLQRAYDQIIHDVCLQRLPVIFAIDRAGLVGEDGQTHQGVFDLSYLTHIPNLTVVAPRDVLELRGALRFALRLDGPVAIRYPRGASPRPAPTSSLPIRLGRCEQVVKGHDVCVIALGSMVEAAERAAAILAPRGVSCRVVNARFAAPIDEGFIAEMVERRIPIVTVEEAVVEGGFGSLVAQAVFRVAPGTQVSLLNLGIPRSFISHGSRRQLLTAVGLDPEGIARRVEEFVLSEWSRVRVEGPRRQRSAEQKAKGERIGQGTP